MSTRVYIVRPKSGEGTPRLIEAPNPAQAARHVVRTTLSIDMASQRDLIDAMKAGVEVETAAAEPTDPS